MPGSVISSNLHVDDAVEDYDYDNAADNEDYYIEDDEDAYGGNVDAPIGVDIMKGDDIPATKEEDFAGGNRKSWTMLLYRNCQEGEGRRSKQVLQADFKFQFRSKDGIEGRVAPSWYKFKGDGAVQRRRNVVGGEYERKASSGLSQVEGLGSSQVRRDLVLSDTSQVGTLGSSGSRAVGSEGSGYSIQVRGG